MLLFPFSDTKYLKEQPLSIVKKEIDKYFLQMLNAISVTIYELLTNVITDAIKAIRDFYTAEDGHHIVAKAHPLARTSRLIYSGAGLNINDARNIANIKRVLHMHLHTSMYFYVVDTIMLTYGGGFSLNRKKVCDALLFMKITLETASDNLVI